jgi:predicted Rossmann fold nucleotide-binding protein DprA/Smf involved in DNA uptake
MATFMGGSAPAMAAQIAEGFILVSQATLKGFQPAELNALRVELDRLLREVRAEIPPQADPQASQLRNRKLARLSSGIQVVQGKLTSRR